MGKGKSSEKSEGSKKTKESGKEEIKGSVIADYLKPTSPPPKPKNKKD